MLGGSPFAVGTTVRGAHSLLAVLATETPSLEHARSAQIVGEMLNLIAGERPGAAVVTAGSVSTRRRTSRRAAAAPVSIATLAFK